MMKSKGAARLATLLLGAGLIALPAAAPAQKKKDGKDQPPPIQLSDAFRKVAEPAQKALGEKNYTAAEPLVAQMEQVAKNPDEIYLAQVFRFRVVEGALVQRAAGNQAVYIQGEAALVGPLDALIANPKLDKANLPAFLYKRGQIEYSAKRYKEAISFFERARDAGSTERGILLNIASARAEMGDPVGATREIRAAIDREKAAGVQADQAWYRYALGQLNKAKQYEVWKEWARLYLADYPTRKNWRAVLLDYRFNTGNAQAFDKRMKVDMWRLLRVNKALADQIDYAELAEDLFDVGLAVEAKSVIDEGRAAGKIPASFAPANSLYGDATRQIAVDGPLEASAKRAAAAATGVPAAATADAYLGTGDYAKAIELYKLALTKGGVKVDEVNTHLGMAQALAGDKAAAKATLALVKAGPRGDIAAFWTVWLDQKTPTVDDTAAGGN
ncbi:hypothetical protein [Sphingomonas sp.]|uniref:hypothetical protein n=1 Tax=Sphingomonas sp. TaxID=28214 RepID=UPI001D91B623|nr:hypothetical protein [Sphingomonas sp.]MBX9797739.1 hypothetical protein [Sphingomonas sp.]